MEEISHPATIIAIGKTSVTVSLLRHESCGACQLREICGMGAKQRQEFEVPTNCPEQYAKGQKVQLLLKAADAWQAAFLAYGLPLLLLLAALFGAYAASDSENLAVLAALAILPLYYFALYLYFRLKGKKLQIRIR